MTLLWLKKRNLYWWCGVLKWFYYPYRCMIMELASSLVEGAKEDLIDLIYSFIKYNFQVSC